MMKRWLPFLVLIALGGIWGMSFPLNKIAVSEGYRHFGVIFWNQLVSFVLLLLLSLWRGKWPVFSSKHFKLYAVVMLFGSVLPNIGIYQAAVYLPGGLSALMISLVPMFAFPIALFLGQEEFSITRMLGLVLGMIAIVLIMAPSTSLPDRALVIFVPLALIAPFFYGLEGNLVAKLRLPNADPVQILTAAMGLGVIVSAPPALLSNHMISPLPPYGLPDFAIVAAAVINTIAYAGYVWLVGRAGAVFAAQVAYLVTGSGVFWSMFILGETYSGYIWAAMGIMFVGMFLVQPRDEPALDPSTGLGDTV
ncbi:DMT family transporter [Cochlodiniinecator piscidefendens]|uniref:DMT family transporter n=1 Tax=Cochlodiniinecator piscidefendens TaxID=2715756 RepID=UPI001407A887|nr:DMT family transporter [Cochlodiniinecator piscidefendens]